MNKYNAKPSASLYLRASCGLDKMLEEMARTERRTKAAVLTLALEEYAERHHPELFAEYRGGAEA